eukprot:10005047-Lingulodinium_polyedra.AAC.1
MPDTLSLAKRALALRTKVSVMGGGGPRPSIWRSDFHWPTRHGPPLPHPRTQARAAKAGS